jgi:signal transduction histidine kinase
MSIVTDESDRLRAELMAAHELLSRQDNLLAVVAHEVRNPLGPVLMSVDALLLEAGRRDLGREELLHRLALLQRYVLRMRDDLNRLLDFSRFRSGRVELHLEEVDLSEVVRDTVHRMEPVLAASGCELHLSVDAPVRGVWDAMRLGQIVWNLVSNAAKYAAGTRVEIATSADAHTATLVVADHGAGIPEEGREMIFAKFERAGARTHHTGFGIGLWLVRKLVEALGGSIDLHSIVGKGTKFTVRLPRRAP